MEYLLFLQNVRLQLGVGVEDFFLIISSVVTTALVFVPFVIYWLVDKEMGLFTLLNFMMARTANGLIKVTACVFRPWILDARIEPSAEAKPGATGYSFPSGHVANVTSIAGAIALSVKRSWLKWVCWILVFLTALSRNYLGVHTLQDVAVSFLVTFALLLISRPLWRWLKEHKDQGLKAVIAVGIFCVVAFIYTWFKPYPVSDLVDPIKMQKDTIQDLGCLFGFALGLYLQCRFVTFDTHNMTFTKYAVRILTGIAFLLATYFIFHSIGTLMDERVAACLTYGMLVFAGTFLVPLVFSKIEAALR